MGYPSNLPYRMDIRFVIYITYGKQYRRIYFTIDDEGLYDEPYVHAVGEIARELLPITFQWRMDIRLTGF